MSKNVAVFVDVANIFYAAKAAGMDIDYVTLLKSATAGRDFVRAYAYTGLDPENENQRNFHDFLRRSGYKVVSKDIRKYGDGRIKANLDIELVVDMMRMATHIDIAVVISGDGDFAPAIRAVQQMGVRVEVISFKGNTSSDLIDVADVFMDISHIARVEKGVRSGRRVAAEDDLSMTEVPEKETDLGVRRRRGPRRDERPIGRPAAPAVVATGADLGLPSNVIALPGERLSRGPRVIQEEVESEPAAELEAEAEAETPVTEGSDVETEEGRRRRRRRGGRGRGRGRRPEGEAGMGEAGMDEGVMAEPIASDAVTVDEEDLLEEEVVPLPQHSTFGSVWDSQIGVPTSATAGVPYTDDEADEDEPEIPEYLLAERRAAGRNTMNRGRCNNRGGRTSPGYQTALDRERYGRSGASAFGGGGVAPNRTPDRSRGGQGGQGGQRSHGGRPSQPPRAPRTVTNEPRREQERPVVSSSEPWSEVPPEVQELLRQEQLRRQSAPRAAAPAPVSAPAAASGPAAGDAPAAAPAAARGRRPRSTTAVTASVPEPVAEAPAAQETAPPAPRRRTSTRAATAKVAEPRVAEPAAPAAPTAAASARKARAAKAPAPVAAAAPEVVASPAAAPARRARVTRSAAVPVVQAPSEAPAVAADAPAPKPRRRSTKAASEPSEG